MINWTPYDPRPPMPMLAVVELGQALYRVVSRDASIGERCIQAGILVANGYQLVSRHNKILGQPTIKASTASQHDISPFVRLAMLLSTGSTGVADTTMFQMVNDSSSTDFEGRAVL